MKRIGILLLFVGIFLIAVGSALFFADFPGFLAFTILSTVAGFTTGSVGFALLFFQKPEKKRRKAAFIGLIVSGGFMSVGIVSIFMQLIGARVELIVGVFIFCFFYGTLALKNKFEKWKIYTRSNRDALFLSLFDFLGLGTLFLGMLFKIQRWPWANNMMTIGMVILAIGIFAWNQKFKSEVIHRKKTEDQLKESLEKIEEKQKEILDSINYAKRIQRALLASEYLLKNNLPEHFVLFQPKDIVSGDFYWAAPLSNGNFALVTADCTGHGVPGAFMSLLNISCLNEAINERKLQSSSAILNHTRSRVIQLLADDGSGEGGKDGMDCSLLVFDFANKKMQFSAANNPVWIIRDKKIIELLPDKMPVGKHDKDNISFREELIELKKGDLIYTLTDGYADQFGGPRGKKFKYKTLQEVLLRIFNLPMEAQKKELSVAINHWKGDLEQVDDICLIGIRV